MQKAAGDLTAAGRRTSPRRRQAAKRELDRLEQASPAKRRPTRKSLSWPRSRRNSPAKQPRTRPVPTGRRSRTFDDRQARNCPRPRKAPDTRGRDRPGRGRRRGQEEGRSREQQREQTRRLRQEAKRRRRQARRTQPSVSTARSRPPTRPTGWRRSKKANAEDQEKRKDRISTGRGAQKGCPGTGGIEEPAPRQDGQKAKQQAQDALQRAANHTQARNQRQGSTRRGRRPQDLAENYRATNRKGDPSRRTPPTPPSVWPKSKTN